MRCSVASWPCFSLLLIALAPWGPIASAPAQTSVLVGTAAEQRAEARIHILLSTPLEVRAFQERLESLTAYLAEKLGVRIELDQDSLEAINIRPDSLVTVTLSERPAGLALQAMLRSLDPTLTCIIDGEHLLITTREEAQQRMQYRIYVVADLIEEDDIGQSKYEPLMDTIKWVIEPASWEDEGGSGAIRPLPTTEALICCQTRETHEKIDRLLTILRQVRDPSRTIAEIASDSDAIPKVEESAEIEALLAARRGPKIDANPEPWRVPQRYDE